MRSTCIEFHIVFPSTSFMFYVTTQGRGWGSDQCDLSSLDLDSTHHTLPLLGRCGHVSHNARQRESVCVCVCVCVFSVAPCMYIQYIHMSLGYVVYIHIWAVF